MDGNIEKTDLPADVLKCDPTVHPTAFIAKGAIVVGDVRLSAHASVWYQAVLRGDINYISIGERTNIQDGCILHLENNRSCIVGADVTVGHRAILHGCTIEDGCLIGMGAIVLNGAVVKRGSVVGAGAVVTENTVIDEYSLAIGVPAKVIRKLDSTIFDTHVRWAAKYVNLAKIHKQKLH